MTKRIATLILAGGFLMGVGLTPQPSEALTLTYSDQTKRLATFLQFRGDYDLPFGLNISGGLGIAPDLSSFVSPLPPTSSLNIADALAQDVIKWDTLLDADLNLGYNFNLLSMDLGVGRLSTTLVPYLGYRHMFTFTGSPKVSALLSGTASDLSSSVNNRTSQLQGINYGATLKVGLPLGFSAYAEAGASSLLGGSLNDGSTTEPIKTNGMTLPRIGIGGSWQLPFINLASVYAGYSGTFLPRDLRLSNELTNGTTMVHSANLGFRILWFGL